MLADSVRQSDKRQYVSKADDLSKSAENWQCEDQGTNGAFEQSNSKL